MALYQKYHYLYHPGMSHRVAVRTASVDFLNIFSIRAAIQKQLLYFAKPAYHIIKFVFIHLRVPASRMNSQNGFFYHAAPRILLGIARLFRALGAFHSVAILYTIYTIYTNFIINSYSKNVCPFLISCRI
jgi:hypothetical protein